MQVLLLDEVSMIDVDAFGGIMSVLSTIDDTRRPNVAVSDCFGSVHMVLFGDFKQLPPATSKGPFIIIPEVHLNFDYRCLTQNRRVVDVESRRMELEEFHTVLTDISLGIDSPIVRHFFVQAYIRGFSYSAETCPFESNTAVFTKRRYRDKHNRTLCRRIARKHNHSVKIKAKVRPRGTRSGSWYPDNRVQMMRKRCRTQSLWNLHLAGDFHHSVETGNLGSRPHSMRCMLTANLCVEQRFANGTQGRLMEWHPGATENKRRAVPAYHHDLMARFCKESSLSKASMCPEVDFIDVEARQENLAVKGEPIMLQLPIVPAYSLTIHKTQAVVICFSVIL